MLEIIADVAIEASRGPCPDVLVRGPEKDKLTWRRLQDERITHPDVLKAELFNGHRRSSGRRGGSAHPGTLPSRAPTLVLPSLLAVWGIAFAQWKSINLQPNGHGGIMCTSPAAAHIIVLSDSALVLRRSINLIQQREHCRTASPRTPATSGSRSSRKNSRSSLTSLSTLA